mgnify:FL=1
MKKIIFILTMFLVPSIVMANEIKDINMNIYIDSEGTAYVTEIWDVTASEKTEFYKQYKNLFNSDIVDYRVSMNEEDFELIDWDINKSFSEKAYKYGYNYIEDGTELCFGISKYGNNTYTLRYNITNFIYNTSDGYQMAYWNLIQKSSDRIDQVYIRIYSDFKYEDTLDVWGYGKYGTPTYVSDGVIEVSSEEALTSDEYITILVKFPKDTFNVSETLDKTFDEYLTMANEGAELYTDDYEGNSLSNIIIAIIVFLFPTLVIVLTIIYAFRNGYGYIKNKKINKKEVLLFRDIPCNKNMYYANTLISLNNTLFAPYKETNILGAIILKWVDEDKIRFINETKGVFDKNNSKIDLTIKPTFDIRLEEELFDMMYEASNDGILETKELEKWCRKNYTKFLELFTRIKQVGIERLKSENHIYKRKDKKECKCKNVMDDTLYEETIKLYGLKKFLVDFSRIGTREVLEVHLWNEYLTFAYLFGIADKVTKQLKNLYPEVVQDMSNNNIDYGMLLYINHISTSSVNAASTAKAKAEGYSAGGGGFASGGGGGGSFGGGGSMGSR